MKNGDIEFMKWVEQQPEEECAVIIGVQGIEGAAANGHLEVLQWLCKHLNDLLPKMAFYVVAEAGHL